MASKGCELQDVVILDGVRMPIGRFGGTLKNTSVLDLGAAVIKGVVERAGVPADQLDEVIMGHCRQAGNGPNPARAAAFYAGVPTSVPGVTVNKACPSALRGLIMAANSIQLGDGQLYVAGGMDSMSTIPHILKGARFEGFRLGHITIADDWLTVSGLGGLTAIQGADYLARKYGVSRQEQDEFSLESHQKAIAAWQNGAYDGEILPYTVPAKGKQPAATIARDENPRADTSLEQLSKLPPAAPDVETVTAGNACGMGDAAAAVLVSSRQKARELGLTPKAHIVSYGVAGVEDVRAMFEGPPMAIKKALDKAGLTIEDMDLIELNEAFAAQALANERVARWDRCKLNVNGGAIALGHPTGHTGARLIVTLMNALRKRGKEMGVAAICGGDAIGVAVVIRVES